MSFLICLIDLILDFDATLVISVHYKWPFKIQIVAISGFLCQVNPSFLASASRSCFQMFCGFQLFSITWWLHVNLVKCVHTSWISLCQLFVNTIRWRFSCFCDKMLYPLFNLLCLYIKTPDILHTMMSSYVTVLIILKMNIQNKGTLKFPFFPT